MSAGESIARLTATRFAVPPVHVAPSDASTCQPSAASQGRHSSQAMITPTMMESVEQAAAPSTRGPSAATARRSHRTSIRNTSAGRRCARIAVRTPSMPGAARQQPAIASAVEAA